MMLRLHPIACAGLICSTIGITGCGNSRDAEPQPTSFATSAAVAVKSDGAPDPAKIEAFNRAVKAEPKVIDFVYDPHAAIKWTIGVRDDGTPRYGYAEYFCELMADHGLPKAGSKVRIVDYHKFMQPGGNGRDASLGSVDCGTSEHMMP